MREGGGGGAGGGGWGLWAEEEPAAPRGRVDAIVHSTVYSKVTGRAGAGWWRAAQASLATLRGSLKPVSSHTISMASASAAMLRPVAALVAMTTPSCGSAVPR